MPHTEFGWVIEKGVSESSSPLYWTGEVNTLSWNEDNLQAIRFAREIDAKRFMDKSFNSGNMLHRVREHGWD